VQVLFYRARCEPGRRDRTHGIAAMATIYFFLKLNFWPPMEASYIRPPLVTVNTAMPFW
jgi:hypothetical protein